MIEIFGYWVSISLMTLHALIIPLFLIEAGFISWVEHWTSGDVKLKAKILDFFMGIMSNNPLGDILVFVFWVSGASHSIIALVSMATGNFSLIIWSDFARQTATFFGYSSIVVGGLYVIDGALKRGYQMYKKVKTLLDKES